MAQHAAAKPLRDSYTPRPRDPIERTENEDGPEHERRRRLNIWHETPVRYRMTPTQVATFKAFWKADLNTGAVALTMPIWGFDGAGYQTRTVKIRDISYMPAGPADTYVGFTLSIRDF